MALKLVYVISTSAVFCLILLDFGKLTWRHSELQVKRQLGIQLDAQNVQLEQPLMAVGDFEVPLRFPPNVPLPGGREGVRLDVNLRRK